MSDPIVEAINDLTRVTIALNGGFGTQSEAVRRLAELSISPARIASIMSIPVTNVYSVLAKQKKKKGKGTE